MSIAAAITAYARINMNRYKNIKGNKYLGGDTDSAIMEKELAGHLVGKELGMMKQECRIKLGLFADKKLYLMKDNNGVTVIKSRGVGRDVTSGRDILEYRDFLKLFGGQEIKTVKTKFRVMSDGIYITPQTITVRISQMRALKITEELNEILINYFHPLYNIASEIKAINITSLTFSEGLFLITPLMTSLKFNYSHLNLFIILLYHLMITVYIIVLPFKMKLLGSYIKHSQTKG